jgi:hypothetical protein
MSPLGIPLVAPLGRPFEPFDPEISRFSQLASICDEDSRIHAVKACRKHPLWMWQKGRHARAERS